MGTRKLSQFDIVELTWFFTQSEAEIAGVHGGLRADDDGAPGGGGGPSDIRSGLPQYSASYAQTAAVARARRIKATLDCLEAGHRRTLADVYGPRPRGVRASYAALADLALVARRTHAAVARASSQAYAAEYDRLLGCAYTSARTEHRATPSFAAELVLRAVECIPTRVPVPNAVIEHQIALVLDRAVGPAGGERVPQKRHGKAATAQKAKKARAVVPAKSATKIADPEFLALVRAEAQAMLADAAAAYVDARIELHGRKAKRAEADRDREAFDDFLDGKAVLDPKVPIEAARHVRATPNGRVVAVAA